MTDIIEDYLKNVETRLGGDDEQKRQIIRELRGHLWEKVDELQAAQPERPRDDIQRKVIQDFGNPHDLALAYSPSGPVLKKATTGETVLSIGRAVGRGTGKVLKGIAIGLAIILVIAVGAGVWAYYEFRPLLEKNAPYPVFDYDQYCEKTACSSEPATTSFYVHPEAREIRLDLNIAHKAPSNGSISILVKDPSGAERLNHTYPASATPAVYLYLAWPAQSGNWSVTYSASNFTGWFDLGIDAIGLPKDAIPWD